MNKSKIATLLIMLALVAGVLIFPLVANTAVDEPQTDDHPVTTQAILTSASAESAETTVSVAKTKKATEHTTVSRKNTKPHQTTAYATRIDKDGSYYDLESVVLYLDVYGALPQNYITKKQAQALGWNGGSVERYKAGASIGGDRFGNYENRLPKGSYTECDLDTNGGKSRGAKRLIFSNDGRYYYTDDHYKSFTEYVVKEGKVEKK